VSGRTAGDSARAAPEGSTLHFSLPGGDDTGASAGHRWTAQALRRRRLAWIVREATAFERASAWIIGAVGMRQPGAVFHHKHAPSQDELT